MNRYSLSVAGPQAVLQAQNYHFDICILGTTSFSPEFGFSCESEADCFLKRIALSHSRHVMVLMDSGKYGLINTHRICTAEQIDILVSDHQLSQEQKQFSQQREFLYTNLFVKQGRCITHYVQRLSFLPALLPHKAAHSPDSAGSLLW